jgi:phage protein D
LSVRGLNVLHSFRTEQHTFSWDNKRDSDIAVELGNKKVQSGQPGLGIEVRVDPRDEQPETYVLMNNQYDIVFLLERARKHDYEVVLRDDDTGRYLFFGPSDTKRVVPTYRLSWGQTLSSFRPTLTTAKQISEVVVRGWDRRANKAIEESAKWTDLVKDENEKKRLTQLAQAFGNRKEIITDRPVHTAAEAKELAQKILKNQLSGMVQGSGATVGLPDLRAGRKVVIDKLGPKFDGEYFITKSTHTINDSGYRTQFEARRDPTDQSPATEPK